MGYGFIFRDANNNVICDNSSVMSQIIGVFDIPDVDVTPFWTKSKGDYSTYKYNATISGLDFSNGTPYVAFFPKPRAANNKYGQIVAPPQIAIGSSSISMEHNYRTLSYPDDIGWPGNTDMTMIVGVYNG